MCNDLIKQIAVQNALSSIGIERRFPNQVFVHGWEDYLFFYPDVLFEARFIEVKNLLLKEEDASVIAVVNLGNANNQSAEGPRSIFLDRETTSKDYVAGLMGDGSPTSWMFLMDRYVCASDKGHWSIYCEKENDISVVAIGEALSRFTCSELAKLLNAQSIEFVSMPATHHLFDFQRLVPEWRSALTAKYRRSNRAV